MRIIYFPGYVQTVNHKKNKRGEGIFWTSLVGLTGFTLNTSVESENLGYMMHQTLSLVQPGHRTAVK